MLGFTLGPLFSAQPHASAHRLSSAGTLALGRQHRPGTRPLTPPHIWSWATAAFEWGRNLKISHVLIPQAWLPLINTLGFLGPTRSLLQVSA